MVQQVLILRMTYAWYGTVQFSTVRFGMGNPDQACVCKVLQHCKLCAQSKRYDQEQKVDS